jgi:hypothetical protein
MPRETEIGSSETSHKVGDRVTLALRHESWPYVKAYTGTIVSFGSDVREARPDDEGGTVAVAQVKIDGGYNNLDWITVPIDHLPDPV